MRRFIDTVIDVLYPPAPGKIDRGPLTPKILIIVTLGFLLLFGILARQ